MRGGPDMAGAPPSRLDVAPPTGPAEVFAVPVEMVLYSANASGQMFLRRWSEKGATFLRTARVWRVNDRLVAEVSFAAPVCPEAQTACVVQLGVALWENLAEVRS